MSYPELFMKNSYFILALFLLAIALPFSTQAREIRQSKSNPADCQLISSREAMNRAQSKAGGKVVSVKLDRKGKKSIYRVRVLVGDKRIKNLTIKACR